MPRRVPDPAAHGARSQHCLGKADGTQRRRRKGRTAADGDPEWVYAARKRRPRRKARVHLGAEEDPVRQHIIVAALKSGKEASAFVEGVDGLKQIG